jgi:hypothetical protein
VRGDERTCHLDRHINGFLQFPSARAQDACAAFRRRSVHSRYSESSDLRRPRRSSGYLDD